MRNVKISIIQIVAAMGVFIIHLAQMNSVSGIMYRIIDIGRYGAEIFMVLSGYLIMKSLDKSQSTLNFFIRRFSKLLPAYYAIVSIAMIYIYILGTETPSDNMGGGGDIFCCYIR